METCSVVLTFEPIDEILWCDHSNETSLAVLLHCTICISIFYNVNFDFLLNFYMALLGLVNCSNGTLTVVVAMALTSPKCPWRPCPP